ncbi:uncharacterized protein LOC110463267 isoform X2 [Mizuhopecten yessoensis]|uniref:uncharacterized protein LOC110463267 isoform X2 n=1 Tax=Mizuhopecten yessoensis TaxID=6573 RepID=UPI000B4599A9|nr:uncharacterized protein LOC110463267 isoform X2 [Mizuhopecten yessoensis]
MLSLRRVSGWNGNGMPEDDWLTQSVHVDPVTKYPKFYSDTFIKLSISDIKRLNIQMSIWPQQLEGLVLFNEGRIPGSFVYLIIHKGVLRFCFNCGQLSVCENVQDVESMRWYRVSIIVSGIMSSIRINLGKAVQLTSPGLPYYTGSHVFVGGGESQDWVIFTAITGTDRGFSGTFHEVTINGQHYTLRTQPLENSRGFMNTEGVSSTEKIMEILERSDSKVVLRCDFSHYAHSESDVYVEWFNVDKKIKSSPDRKITPRLPGNSYLGALTLSAKHHGSGLYVCMIRHKGRLTNHIAFVLTRDNTDLVYDMAIMEVTGEQDFLIFMAIFAMLALIFSTCRMFQLAKEDGIRPMLEKLKQFRARSSNKDTVETEFRQPPGIDDLYKAEMIPEGVANEPVGDSNDDTKDSQDKDSEIVETPETENIAIDLHSSYSCEDDGNEGQQPITPSFQSIPNHPSMHGTSGAVLHQPSTISHGARISSVTLYDPQSARSNINDDEIPRRSSALPRDPQSARSNINDDGIPRRLSVKLRDPQSARSNINDDEIPRRSSVKFRSTQSAREDTIDDKIPRKTVKPRGTQSARDDIDDEILSSEIVTIDDSQYAPPDQKHETSQWSPYSSSISARGDVAKGVSSYINSQGDVSRGMSYHRASRIDDVRGVSSHTVPNTRSSFSSGERLGSSHQVPVTENNDVQPPQPQISWTHRSTHQIANGSMRSRTSPSPSRQQSSILENQLSCSLPPAGSPSPPKSPLVWTSPSHQQPDLAITVSANRSLTGKIDPQYTLPTLPSTQTLPQPPSQGNMAGEDVVTSSSEETSQDGTSSSSDQSSDLDPGTDTETSLSFPPLPTPPPPTP